MNYPFIPTLQKQPRFNPLFWLLVLATILILIGIVRAEEIYLTASWYSIESLIKEGTWKNGKERMMANGQKFNELLLTCATRLFPLGVQLKITNTQNQKSVVVVVTDRIGKRFAKTRIDLTPVAFLRIAKLEEGIISVRVERIK